MSCFGFVTWHVKKYWAVHLYLAPLLFGAFAPYFYPGICEYLGWVVAWTFAVPILLGLACAIKIEYGNYLEANTKIRTKGDNV